jgi:biopolymer transport protein ExbD
MDFRRNRVREEPEINLIPMIDVLLVILIFLMITTTYARFSELQINLPQASAEKQPDRPNEINVAVDATGQYVVNKNPVPFTNVESMAQTLRRVAGKQTDPVIVINADAKASHQSVINVMEAARLAGYVHVTFATQTPPK